MTQFRIYTVLTKLLDEHAEGTAEQWDDFARVTLLGSGRYWSTMRLAVLCCVGLPGVRATKEEEENEKDCPTCADQLLTWICTCQGKDEGPSTEAVHDALVADFKAWGRDGVHACLPFWVFSAWYARGLNLLSPKVKKGPPAVLPKNRRERKKMK